VVVALCSLLVLAVVQAKILNDHVKGNDFVFLGKFCFIQVPAEPPTAGGLLSWKINNLPNVNPKVVLAFYHDAYNNRTWPDIYQKSISCQDKFAQRHDMAFLNQSSVLVKDVVSPHFWYVAAVNCGGEIDLDYEMSFINTLGDKWQQQFSCDEIGLEGLYISYFIFYIIGVCIHAYAVFTLVRASSYHTIVKLLSIAIGLEGTSVFGLFIHYTVYEKNGVGAPALKGIGDLLDLAAQVVFIFLIVLIAKGWCISKTRLDDRRVVLIGVGVLGLAYLALFIWEMAGVDPASTLYIYQSPPGIIILVFRAVTMLWFIWSVRATYMEENHPSKRKFYLWFGIAYVAWFLALPLIAIIAAGTKNAWNELKTVMILYVTANALAIGGLQFLLWPTRASEYFQISARLDLAGTIPYDAI